MPEESFEERARRKAEAFGMEPDADVWRRVQEAIRPERRRRSLLLWWLLPLCMTGIVGGFLLKRSGEVPVRAGAVALDTQEKAAAHLSVKETAAAKTRRPAGNVKDTMGENELEKKSDGNINSRAEKYKIRKEPDDEWKNQYSANEEKRVVQQENKSDIGVSSQPSDTTMNVIKKKAEEPAFLPEENEDALQANRISSQAPLKADSIVDHDKKTPLIAFAGKDSASVKLNVNKATKQKKQTDRKRWQMGIVTEIGLTSWGKDLLSKEVETTSKYNTLPSASSTTLDSLKAATSELQRTKNGVDAGIGFMVRKETGHHFYISGQFSYRYQQYQVYNLRTSSGTFLNANSGYLVNKNNYHDHFISLYAGAGKMLFTGKRNALSVEAGLDNSLLLTTRQQNTKQSALFNADANKAVRADFYSWQPQLFLSLPFDWHAAGKVRFAVSPFARVGLHSYQKNGAGYGSNHLMSAGVQAVYFFR